MDADELASHARSRTRARPGRVRQATQPRGQLEAAQAGHGAQVAVRQVQRGRSGSLDDEERRTVGALANEVRDALQAALEERRQALRDVAEAALLDADRVDLSLPGRRPRTGSYTRSRSSSVEIVDVFVRLGFRVVEGPEIEDDWHNFEALNIPPDHPARTMKDSIYVDDPGPPRAAPAHRDVRRADPHDGVAAAAGLRHRAGPRVPARDAGSRPTCRSSIRSRASRWTRASRSPT